jgi:hypothetical protein
MSRKKSKRNDIITAKSYTTEKIQFSKEDLKDFYRADCVFRGVAMNVPTYEGRVFINNPTANLDTQKNSRQGYVGSYVIFGHAKCLGDEGHCDVRTQRYKFDEVPYRLAPEPYISIKITEYLKNLSKKTQDFTVTVVPRLCKVIIDGDEKPDLENVVKIEKVSIEIYDKEGE